MQFKYYDIAQGYGPNEAAYITIGGLFVTYDPRDHTNLSGLDDVRHYIVNVGDPFAVDVQYSISSYLNGSLAVTKSPHDRVDCCLHAGWHSCTEFQVCFSPSSTMIAN